MLGAFSSVAQLEPLLFGRWTHGIDSATKVSTYSPLYAYVFRVLKEQWINDYHHDGSRGLPRAGGSGKLYSGKGGEIVVAVYPPDQLLGT